MKRTVMGKRIALCVCLCLFIAVVIRVPDAINSANMDVFAARGKDIFVAITMAGGEHERDGYHPSYWPRTSSTQQNDPIGNSDSIAIYQKTYTSTSAYFWDLMDGDNLDNAEKWSPYVWWEDFSKFAGAGVPVLPTNMSVAEMKAAFLTGDYNGWNIIANLRDDMPDNTPLMFSKNLDISIEDLIAIESPDMIDSDNKLGAKVGMVVKQPFGKNGVVVILKGGGIRKIKPRDLKQPRVFIGDADFKAWSELSPKPEIIKATAIGSSQL